MAELKGTLKVKGDTNEFGANKFKKRLFVIETHSDYPQKIEIELTQKHCELLDDIEVGDKVKLEYNIRGREWESPDGEIKYFNSLQAWKLEIEF